MNKKFLTISLLIICSLSLLDASSSSKGNLGNIMTINSSTMTDDIAPVDMLNALQKAYYNQPNNASKTKFINNVLEMTDGDVLIEKKISEVQALYKIISADINLRSGWFYNNPEEQPNLDWLQKEKNKITTRLAQLEWQAKSFGLRATLQTAKWATIYLGIILAAYLSQEQLSKMMGDATGQKYHASFGDLAWMPIDSILELAKNATLFTVNTLTGETAQKAAVMALAMAQTAGQYTYEAAATIGAKGQEKLQSGSNSLINSLQTGIHSTAQAVANVSDSTPPSWWNYWTHGNDSIANSFDNVPITPQ